MTVRPPSFNTPADPIRIGISTCLLGQHVRYDGGHKRDAFLVETFGRFVEWVPVCPEVELGLGTPRESMRLVKADGDVRLMTGKTAVDHTAAMRRFAARRVAALGRLDLCGYVLKKDSPSCGMDRVKVYERGGGMPVRRGRGLFAQVLMDAYPLLPVEEEGRLHDPLLRESFVERVFAYRRLRSLFAGRWTVGGLVAFHAAHELQLLSHSPKIHRELGLIVARAKGIERGILRRRFEDAFMRGLAVRATTPRAGARARARENEMKLELLHWAESEPPEEEVLRARLESDGFEIFCWSDRPGASYTPHSHDHDESLWCVSGRITFGIAGRDYQLGPGDRLMLPKGTVHTAVVGAEGATYLIGQKG